MIDLREAFLAHYGVKGQKWGVRRYQNRDGTLTSEGRFRYAKYSSVDRQILDDGDTVYPKGFVFNRIGDKKKDVNISGALYASYRDYDAAQYVSEFCRTAEGIPLSKLVKGKTTIQHLEVVSDIRQPSLDDTASTIELMLKVDKNLCDAYVNVLNNPKFEGAGDRLKEAVNSGDTFEIGYVVTSSFGWPECYPMTRYVYSTFRRCGYDALPDFHDAFSSLAKAPVIIINPDKVKMTSKTAINKDIVNEAIEYIDHFGSLSPSDIDLN